MSLQGPSQEDLRKIHAEVNQLANQRFVLTTGAISVFGLVIAWLIPTAPPQSGTPIGGFTIGGAILLLLLLFLLYLYGHLLRRMLRVYTAYLVVTGTSGWEQDMAKYCKDRKYWAYTKPQSVVFMIIGLFAAAFPCFLAILFSLQWQPEWGLAALGIVWLFYEVFVWLMGFQDLWSTDETAKTKWETLKGV